MGWCMREPYCPLSSAVCNATIPTLPLFEMAESACLPFCLSPPQRFLCYRRKRLRVFHTAVRYGKHHVKLIETSAEERAILLCFTLSFVYEVYIGFLSHMCDWTVAVAQYSKFVC
jgi:hypothetical protein